MSEAALVAFAKDPTRTRVKTRLKNELTDEQCRTLYSSLLIDCLNQLSEIDSAQTYIACYPDKDSSFFSDLSEKHSAVLINQNGDDLGQKMHHSFEALIKKHRKVIIFGTDVPVLPVSEIEDSLKNNWDVLIGPSEDGGYYAVGMSDSIVASKSESIENRDNTPVKLPNIFANVEWSSGKEYKATLENCHHLNLKVQFLEQARDIDNFEDLQYYAEIPHTNNTAETKFKKSIASLDLFRQVKK